MKKKLRIKIPKVDKETFPVKDIEIDKFWMDLYNPNFQNTNIKRPVK